MYLGWVVFQMIALYLNTLFCVPSSVCQCTVLSTTMVPHALYQQQSNLSLSILKSVWPGHMKDIKWLPDYNHEELLNNIRLSDCNWCLGKDLIGSINRVPRNTVKALYRSSIRLWATASQLDNWLIGMINKPTTQQTGKMKFNDKISSIQTNSPHITLWLCIKMFIILFY